MPVLRRYEIISNTLRVSLLLMVGAKKMLYYWRQAFAVKLHGLTNTECRNFEKIGSVWCLKTTERALPVSDPGLSTEYLTDSETNTLQELLYNYQHLFFPTATWEAPIWSSSGLKEVMCLESRLFVTY